MVYQEAIHHTTPGWTEGLRSGGYGKPNWGEHEKLWLWYKKTTVFLVAE